MKTVVLLMVLAIAQPVTITSTSTSTRIHTATARDLYRDATKAVALADKAEADLAEAQELLANEKRDHEKTKRLAVSPPPACDDRPTDWTPWVIALGEAAAIGGLIALSVYLATKPTAP